MKLSKIKDAAIDTAEAIVDAASSLAKGISNALIDNDLVKGLPFVKSVLALSEMCQNFQNSILLKKIQPFLDELASIPVEKRQKMVKDLENSGYSENVGLTILDQLHRVQLDKKPKMIGMIFKALAEDKCTLEQLWVLLSAVEKLNLQEIRMIRDFCNYDEGKRDAMPLHIQQAYMNSGLATFSAGKGDGSLSTERVYFVPNIFCKLFVELNIDAD